MKAIRTKYLGATNTLGSRIKADDYDRNSITIQFDYELGEYERYKKAAVALCEKLNWDTDLAGGATDTGFVFIFKQSIT